MITKQQSKRLAATSGAITALLAGWTVLVANLDTQRWFAEAWMHPAWIAFDLGLVLAFLALTISIAYEHRAARTLAPALLGVLVADWTISGLMQYTHPRTLAPEHMLLAAGFAIVSTCALGYFLLLVMQHARGWDHNT